MTLLLYLTISIFGNPINGGPKFLDSQPFRSWANSLPGANRPIGPWPIRSLELSFLGLFAPWPFRFLAFSLPGTFAPRSEMARELSFRGTFALRSIRSQEHSLHGTYYSLLVRDIICDTGYILMILTLCRPAKVL